MKCLLILEQPELRNTFQCNLILESNGPPFLDLQQHRRFQQILRSLKKWDLVGLYLMMFVASLVWLIRRHHVSALAAKAAAPIGVIMTIIAICTGALWGKPMWGTAWVWDPRLTSFALMLFFYFAYIAVWNAVGTNDRAADMTSILCLVGSVFALLSRYAVFFWDQGLHQGSSLSLDKEEHVSNHFFFPLLVSMIGFVLLFLTLLLIRTQTEIRKRRIESILSQSSMR